MKQPSRQTLSNWETQAISFLCDITEQVPIPGLEDDPKLMMSKLGRDEARGMLVDLAGALQVDWPAFVYPLSRAWRKRRKAKCERLGWYEPGEQMTPAPMGQPDQGRSRELQNDAAKKNQGQRSQAKEGAWHLRSSQ